jgi:hypothetical protein
MQRNGVSGCLVVLLLLFVAFIAVSIGGIGLEVATIVDETGLNCSTSLIVGTDRNGVPMNQCEWNTAFWRR